MKTLAAMVLVVLFAPSVFCQKAGQPTAKGMKNEPTATAKQETAPKPATDNEAYGKKLLEIAEADAGAIQGGTRAYVLLQIARGYQKENKAKAIELLDNALVSTREMDEDKMFRTRSHLQKDILKTLVPLAPERVDELLIQVDTQARGEVLMSLLGYYEKEKQMDRVIEALHRIAQEQEIPYYAVARVMNSLPKEKSGDALQLFTTALTSYRDHDHTKGGIGFGGTTVVDFPGLIVRHWQQLPPAVVMEAIDEVLKQTEPKEAGSPQRDGLAITSAKGSLSFGSRYEYVLFQLLPVLKQLDPDRADKLLKKYQQVDALVAANPEGTNSLFNSPAKPGDAGAKKSAGGGYMVSSTAGAPQERARTMATMQEYERASQIAEESNAHPQEALARVSTIADLEARASALQGIARANAKKDPAVAKSALRELLELGAKLEGFMQARAMYSCAKLYMQMGEADDAKKAIEKGIAGAEKMYKEDSDGNKAIKAYWPSTQAYALMLGSAGQVSPAWAVTLLDQMPDVEVKAIAEASLASAWLRVPGGFEVTTMSTNKRGTSMYIIN
jgi:tetratricopeptide (TPR) repeat protein